MVLSKLHYSSIFRLKPYFYQAPTLQFNLIWHAAGCLLDKDRKTQWMCRTVGLSGDSCCAVVCAPLPLWHFCLTVQGECRVSPWQGEPLCHSARGSASQVFTVRLWTTELHDTDNKDNHTNSHLYPWVLKVLGQVTGIPVHLPHSWDMAMCTNKVLM